MFQIIKHRIHPVGRITLLLSVFLFNVLLLCANASAEIRDTNWYAQAAKNLILEEDWYTAENYLQNAVKLDNKHAEARYLLAVVNEHKGEVHVAKRFYRMATKLDPNHIDSYLGWARMAGKTDDEGQVFAALGRAKKIEPKNPEVNYQLGKLWLKLHNVKAEAYLQNVLSVNANHRLALEALVSFYKLKRKPAKTNEYQQRLAKIGPARAPQAQAPALLSKWKGRIVKQMDDGRVVINGGRNQNINIGNQFRVYHEEEVFIDPETGEPLGAERDFVARIEITKVRNKFSYARIIKGRQCQKNDVVEPVR